MNILQMAQTAKEASQELPKLSEQQRQEALRSISKNLIFRSADILSANEADLIEAQHQHLPSSLIDRLRLTSESIKNLSQMCLQISEAPQVVGEIAEEYTRPNGLVIQKERIPIGVIGMIFESRPNVIIDGASLAIKSGNSIILKGGKEAQHSNKKLFEVILEATQHILPQGSVNLVETREDVSILLKLNQYIDLMVPRGGSGLIQFVRTHATMPVVAHDKGLCHIYVHKDAQKVIPIVINSKVQRPGVCNAAESLLVHKDYPGKSPLIDSLLNEGVEIRGCAESQKLNSKIKPASDKDYDTEYLDKIISLKIVSNEDEAIEHIKKHSSHHTEAILSDHPLVIEKFLNSLDASAIIINASTRFNDGGELGLGAELGISTSKLHAYGPMGAKEMTTTRFIVRGNGQTR
jgi:glutamate-5-semialdehyde dehydrogenase